MRIIVLFDLKPGADVSAYEAWARDTDIPGVKALNSVHDFQVYRTSGLLGGGSSPYQYIEIIDIADLDRFVFDASTEVMTRMATEFQTFADNPQFILTEKL